MTQIADRRAASGSTAPRPGPRPPLDRRRTRRRDVGTRRARSSTRPRDVRRARSTSPRSRRSIAAVAAAAAAFPAWRATSIAQAGRDHVPDPQPRRRPPQGDRGAPDRRARQGALRRPGRGRARPRDRRVRLRHPAAAQGRVLASRLSTGIDVYSIRQPLGVVAGITPFNFPAMVPMWMFAMAIACGNTFILKPSEKDPSRLDLHGRAAQGGRRARRRLQRRPRRQGRGRRDPRAPGRRRGLASSARRRSPATSTRPGRGTASACRRSAARRTT